MLPLSTLSWFGPELSPKSSCTEGLLSSAGVLRGGALYSDWITRALASWVDDALMDSQFNGCWEVTETCRRWGLFRGSRLLQQSVRVSILPSTHQHSLLSFLFYFSTLAILMGVKWYLNVHFHESLFGGSSGKHRYAYTLDRGNGPPLSGVVALFYRAPSFGRDARGAVREDGDTCLASQTGPINPGDG